MPSQEPKAQESKLPAQQKAEREELLARVGNCLDDLQKIVACPYAGSSSLDCWPTIHELNRLTTAVGELGRAIEIKKVDFEHLIGVMRHIDRRYPKLGLLAFVDGLIRKIENVPVGPVTRINQKLAAEIDLKSQRQLLLIRNLLTSLEWKIAAQPPGTWRELGPQLLELSSGQIKEAKAKAKPATMQEIDFRQAEIIFDGAFGLAVFLEVQRQYLVWLLRWERKVLPVASWVYLLQNTDWDTRLRRVIINPNITPAESKADDKQFQARAKKRRYREKKA